MSICKVLFVLIRGLFVSRSNLILENLALRQQLTVQQRTIKRPKLKRKDRLFWAWLSQIWPDWKSTLIVVKLETVIKWRRQGFGSIRRECLDHFIILSENHLCRILKDYMDYYNNCRTHLSLDRNSPSLRDIEPPSKGKVISIPQVGGLHHVYKRVA